MAIQAKEIIKEAEIEAETAMLFMALDVDVVLKPLSQKSQKIRFLILILKTTLGFSFRFPS